MTDAGMKF